MGARDRQIDVSTDGLRGEATRVRSTIPLVEAGIAAVGQTTREASAIRPVEDQIAAPTAATIGRAQQHLATTSKQMDAIAKVIESSAARVMAFADALDASDRANTDTATRM